MVNASSQPGETDTEPAMIAQPIPRTFKPIGWKGELSWPLALATVSVPVIVALCIAALFFMPLHQSLKVFFCALAVGAGMLVLVGLHGRWGRKKQK